MKRAVRIALAALGMLTSAGMAVGLLAIHRQVVKQQAEQL